MAQEEVYGDLLICIQHGACFVAHGLEPEGGSLFQARELDPFLGSDPRQRARDKLPPQHLKVLGMHTRPVHLDVTGRAAA